MGFDDNRVNIAALMQTHGNVNRAIDVLFTNPPAPIPERATNGGGGDGGDGGDTINHNVAATSSTGSNDDSNSNNDEIADKDKVEKKND